MTYLRKVTMVIIVLLLVALFATTKLGAWITLAALLITLIFVVRPRVESSSMIYYLLSIAVGISAVTYMVWRVTSISVNGWWISVPLFIAEAFGALHLLGFYHTLWPRKEAPLTQTDNPTYYPIYVFVPTVNEGVEIVRPTIRGIQKALAAYKNRYPHARAHIVICNDGYVANVPEWHEMEDLAEEMGVTCVTRTEPGGMKAGNIEHARQLLGVHGNSLLAIFDCDQIPDRDFFLKMVTPFADPSIGWVQTGQYYRNLDAPISRWANEQNRIFYNLISPGKSTLNAAIICGTNFVVRAAAFDEIDGLPQDNVTEDIAASIRLHANWRSLFIHEHLVTGLGPMDFRGYFSQQRRWATGNIGVGLNNWRYLLMPSRNGLTIAQRAQYLMTTTHYLNGLRDLIYIAAPLAYLLLGVSSIDFTSMEAFLWQGVPFWVMSHAAFFYVIRGKADMRGTFLNLASFPIYIGGLLTVMTGKRIGFVVTPKNSSGSDSFRYIRVHMIFLAVCVLGLAVGGYNMLHSRSLPILVSLFWTAYQTFNLLTIVWLAFITTVYESRWASLPNLRDMMPMPRTTAWVASVASVSSVAVLIGAFVLPVSNINQFGLLPEAGAPVTIQPKQPLIGTTWEAYQTTTASRTANSPQDYTVLTRTFSIGDDFDTGWANEVNKQGAIPWITLLFDGKDGRLLDNSLVGIANGVRDNDLRRWASQLRAYNKPVYLIILPHADMPHGAPSAVTGNAKLIDIAPAWLHIQAIFNSRNANQVRWVWAPANVMAATTFAPPTSTVDVILARVEHGTVASDNEIALALMVNEVAAAYPDTPVAVEVFGDANTNTPPQFEITPATKSLEAVLMHTTQQSSNTLSPQAIETTW